MLPPGVFITTMPCRVAALVSMLSTPTPARAIARRRWLPFERFGGDLHAAAADGPVGLQQGLSQVLALQAGADDDFDVSGRLQQIQAVFGQVVQNDDRGHGGAPRGFLDPSSLTPRPISARAPVRQKEASTFPRSPELSRMRQPHFRETNEWGAQRSGLAGASKLVASAVSTLGSDWRRFQVFHLKSVRPKDDSELLARAGRRMRVHVTDAERALRNVRVVDARSVQEIIVQEHCLARLEFQMDGLLRRRVLLRLFSRQKT